MNIYARISKKLSKLKFNSASKRLCRLCTIIKGFNSGIQGWFNICLLIYVLFHIKNHKIILMDS